MTLRFISTFIAALLIYSESTVWAADATLNIGVYQGFNASHPNVKKDMFNALKKEGVHVTFTQELPAQRSLMSAAQGGLDGDILRQSAATESLPSLLQVPVPLKRFQYWVWIKASKACPGSVRDLPNLKPIGILGIKYFDFAYNQSNVGFEQVTSLKTLADMLKLERADYSIADIKSARQLSTSTGIQLTQCFKRPLVSTYGFLYVHEKHRALIPTLEKALMPLKVD